MKENPLSPAHTQFSRGGLLLPLRLSLPRPRPDVPRGYATGSLCSKESGLARRNTAEIIKAFELDPSSWNLLFDYVAGPRYHPCHDSTEDPHQARIW